MDYTLINGIVVDGTGGPGYRADVGVKDGVIAAIAPTLPRTGVVINAEGQVVCPGFIDTHTHTGILWLEDPRMEPKIHQGITTDVPGVDGYSAAPILPRDVKDWQTHLAALDGNPAVEWNWSSFGEYRDRLRGTGINWAPMVGQGNLRMAVMGMQNRPATDDELRRMCDLLDRSLQEGASGLSTGLVYTPQAYTNFEEMVALGRVVAKHDKFFAFHIRTEGIHILRNLAEVLDVGRQSGCAVHISHFKMGAKGVWGKVDQAVELIEAAQKSGVPVTCDQYVYTAGSTTLTASLPPWAHAGGPDKLRQLLQSKGDRARLEHDTLEGTPPTWESKFQTSGPDSLYIAGVQSEANQWVVGKNLTEIGAEWGISPFEVIVRLLLEENLNVGEIRFVASEPDIEAIMRLPWHMFCTDGLLIGKPHPRVYGNYPRILGRYVRERGVLTVEEAVMKSTSAPARRLGLKDRGILAEGKAADIVVFDPATVIDTATYQEPRQYPTGINHVFVNGRQVISSGQHTGELPGYAL